MRTLCLLEPLKRYNASPLRYPGGKSRAARQIALYLPKDLKRLVSPFFGGGSFEFYCALELGVLKYALKNLHKLFNEEVQNNA